jgi:hypothetical protein
VNLADAPAEQLDGEQTNMPKTFTLRRIFPGLALAALGFAALLEAPAFANQPVAVRVSPHIALEPATLNIDLIVERNSDNRALQLSVESENYYRSSLVQLDGDDAPRVTTMRYSSVPAGSYEVKATILGPGEKRRASTSAYIQVFGRAGK